jgi:hypothetical protein
MRDLAALQAQFGAGLDARETEPDVLNLFIGGPRAVSSRFGIYRGNTLANAAKAIEAAYPVIAKIVGSEFFSGLARQYQSRFPSQDGDLNQYGESFAAFLDDFPPAAEMPYLADVARLEWQVHRAHYAADPESCDLAWLAALSPEQQLRLCPRLHPACAVLDSAYPLARIWQVHQDSFRGEIAVDFAADPVHALVFRPRFRVEVAPLGDAEAAFLSSALGGGTLEATLAAAQSCDASFDLGRSLNEWVASSVIVNFILNGD